jgi:hypothetical protein
MGIRAFADESTIRWEVSGLPPEFASSAAMRWDDVAGVAEYADDGTAPDGVMVLRRGATTMDFLPLEAIGVRTVLEAARQRGLVRPLSDLVREREGNARSAPQGA